MKKKVIVAMSGGVDSSVAAALLKKQGFEVAGVFMKLYDSPKFKDGEKRARQVAKLLKIPFSVVDLRKGFKKTVINYFLKEYGAGLTPNPCVVCNKEIKFGLFLEKALVLQADHIATGHYIQRRGFKIYQGRDKGKDQSYFLWQLDQKQISRILFPVGSYIKQETRGLAKKMKLPVFSAPESQEICFVEGATKDFLSRHLKTKKGQIINSQGKVIGVHYGLSLYTIGQRKGIGLPGGPWWVLHKDWEKNSLIVTKNEKELYQKELICQKVNWLSGQSPKLPLSVKVKIRYRANLAQARVSISGRRYRVVFVKPQRAITPGQSVIFYKGQELLGGGIIS